MKACRNSVGSHVGELSAEPTEGFFLNSDEILFNPLRLRLTPNPPSRRGAASLPSVEAMRLAETYQGFPLRGICHEVTDEVAKV